MKKQIIILLVLFVFPFSVSAYTSMDTANAIVKSLKMEPDHWVHDQYRLYYFKDLKDLKSTPVDKRQYVADCIIWIANATYGVEVTAPVKVVLPKKTKEFIWQTYQKWANGYFNEKVFNHLQESSKIVKESSYEIKVEPFTPLTSTPDIKVKNESSDFFSQIPDWLKLLVVGIIIASLSGLIALNLFQKRKANQL